MKSKKKFYFIVILLFLVFPMIVHAKAEMIVDIDKTDLKAGDEVVVTASLSDDTNLYAFTATLNYDASVFEKITETDFRLPNENASISYSDTTNKFGIINKTGTLTGELFEVHLTVKEDAMVGDTNIVFTNITSSNGEQKENYEKISKSVLVTRDAKEGEVLPNHQAFDAEDQEETIIKTFSTIPINIGITIFILLLFLYIILELKSHNPNKKRNILRAFRLILVLLCTLILFFFLANKRRDTNLDGETNYEDSKEIIKYLIELEGTKTEEQKENTVPNNSKVVAVVPPKQDKNKYDVNNDGVVDINDAASSVEHVTEEVHYTVKLSETKTDYYVEKGDIVLEFAASVHPNEKIKKVKIDGTYYDVEQLNDHYSVHVHYTIPGIHEFKITEVLLANTREISTKLSITKEILKDVPTIGDFNIYEDKNYVEFKLVDQDQAFINGHAYIYDGETILAEADIDEVTMISANLTPEKIYRIVAVGTYDLDHDRNNSANFYEDKEIFVHSFLVGGNYNFTFSNLLLTDTIEKEEIPKLSFTSTNTKATTVEKVNLTIDGQEKDYMISKMNKNDYEVELQDASLDLGLHTVQINSFVLKTLKQFKNEQDFTLPEMTYEVLKEAPKVENIKIEEGSIKVESKDKENNPIEVEKKGVHVRFQLEDQDQVVSNLTLTLVDSTNKIVASKTLSKEEFHAYSTKAIFLPYADKNSSNNNYGSFTVEFLADYALGERHNFTNKRIGKQDFYPNTGVKIENIQFVRLEQRWNGIFAVEKDPDGKFATKGEKPYYLQFEVLTEGINSYSRLSAVTINGLNYTLNGGAADNKDEDDENNTRKKYKYVSYTAINVPEEAGIVTVKANRVQFENNGYYVKQNDYYAVPEKTTQFEVLKDKPTIKNLEIKEENLDEKTVTFAFSVTSEDHAFKSGLVELNGQTEEITAEDLEHKEVTFKNIEPNQKYTLVFKANYDLDSGILDPDGNWNQKEEVIYSVPYGMYAEEIYQTIKVTDGHVLSKDQDIYFEKTEPILLDFKIGGIQESLEATPERIVINNQEYTLSKTEDGYQVLVEGYTTSGTKEIKITDVLLNTGKKVHLEQPYTLNPVVLKDEVQIENYQYEIGDKDITITFDTKDYDASLIGKVNVLIQDEDGEIVYNGRDYESNKITFAKKENALRYYVTLTARYDRDQDATEKSQNYYDNRILLQEIISLEENTIALKDIFDIKLYKVQNEGTKENILLMDEVNVEDLRNSKEDYFVEIVMENLPSVHARIKNVLEDENHLLLELEYESTINEDRKETKELKVLYGAITEGIAKNENHPDVAFRTLIENLKANQEVTLTHDYDASLLKTDDIAYVTSEFSGKLYGNGYTIKNLEKPLFNTIKKGTVEDLVLKDITLGIEEHGSLANVTEDATIKNVIVHHVTKTGVKAASDGKNGGLIGTATKTTIDNCGVNDILFSVSGSQENGGFIGLTVSSSITNSYAIGKINGSWNYNAGFVGDAKGTTIKNSYAKVEVSGSTVCSFACRYDGGQSTYENNVALGTSNYAFSNNNNRVENNYRVVPKDIESSQTGVSNITASEVNTNFFIQNVHFDPSIWRLENSSYENSPILKIEKITDLKMEEDETFDESKINLYNNLMKLMPYYDGKKIIEIARRVQDDNLIHKEIVNIVPVEKNGSLVTYLTSDNVKKIAKLKIIYKDQTKVEYNVFYDKNYDSVANYYIPDLKVDYNYKNYVLNANAQIVNNLTNYLLKLDYTNNLDTLTSTADSRLYRDFYNETTRKELREFVLKFLSNSNLASTTNDTAINHYLEREAKENQKIEKVLYMYNYFKRFYSLDIDDLDISDFMLFNLSDFDSSLTPLRIAELFLQDGNNFSTANTNTKYISVLSGYTKLNNIAELLEYLVTGLSNHKMDDWISSQFKGYLVEIKVQDHPEVQYTLWDHLSTPDSGKNDTSYTVYNYILPILTLPKNAAYIISTPVQFIIGSQRSYIKNPEDPYEQSILQQRIASYASRMKDYFDTAYKILEDKTVFNNIHTYQVDKRFAYDNNGALVYQQQLVTEEPFHKNFSEAVGRWNTSDGNAAVAYGDRIEWNAEGLMDGNIDPNLVDVVGPLQEYTYHTWSHESAHNIDARLFLRNNGRRFDAGGEDYADSNLMQSFGINDIVMNLSVYYPKNSQIGSNWTPERINTTDKIHDYYRKVFETIYVMDYLEAQAFLQLNEEEMAVTGIQVSYPNYEKYINDEYAKFRAYQTTGYSQVEASKWQEMHLDSIDDLIDHKIMLYPGVYKYASRGSNSYGGEGLNTVHWYQPNNPYGRPDSYALKWNAYEMLGYAGYEKGYLEYNSNIHSEPKKVYDPYDSGRFNNKVVVDSNYKTDTMALKTITNFDNYDAYKKHRFNEVKNKLEYLDKEINANSYVQKFYDALVKDAKDMKTNVEKRLTDNPNCLSEYWCSRYLANDRGYPESTKVRQEIYYKLKEITDDFTGEIYKTTKQQTIGDFIVKKTESTVDEER